MRQADGYLILFRFTSGAIGVHNANCLESDSNTLLIGICVEDAIAAATTVKVRLNGAFAV